MAASIIFNLFKSLKYSEIYKDRRFICEVKWLYEGSYMPID